MHQFFPDLFGLRMFDDGENPLVNSIFLFEILDDFQLHFCHFSEFFEGGIMSPPIFDLYFVDGVTDLSAVVAPHLAVEVLHVVRFDLLEVLEDQ